MRQAAAVMGAASTGGSAYTGAPQPAKSRRAAPEPRAPAGTSLPMQPPINADTALWALVAVFVVAAATVWTAGARLTRVVDVLAVRTGMGHAFAGMLL